MNASHSFVLANIPFQVLFSSILPKGYSTQSKTPQKQKQNPGWFPHKWNVGSCWGLGKGEGAKREWMGTGLLAWISCWFFREGWEQWPLLLQWPPFYPHDTFHSGQHLLPMSHHLFSRVLRTHHPSAMVQGGTLAQAQPVLRLGYCYRKPDSASGLKQSNNQEFRNQGIVDHGLLGWAAGLTTLTGVICRLLGAWWRAGHWQPGLKPNENEFKCMKLSLSS